MTERLQVRVPSRTKRRLEDAAHARGMTVSSFVLQAAEASADQVLAEQPTVHLTPDQAQALAEALERPAEVNERLRRALTAPAFTWID